MPPGRYQHQQDSYTLQSQRPISASRHTSPELPLEDSENRPGRHEQSDSALATADSSHSGGSSGVSTAAKTPVASTAAGANGGGAGNGNSNSPYNFGQQSSSQAGLYDTSQSFSNLGMSRLSTLSGYNPFTMSSSSSSSLHQSTGSPRTMQPLHSQYGGGQSSEAQSLASSTSFYPPAMLHHLAGGGPSGTAHSALFDKANVAAFSAASNHRTGGGGKLANIPVHDEADEDGQQEDDEENELDDDDEDDDEEEQDDDDDDDDDEAAEYTQPGSSTAAGGGRKKRRKAQTSITARGAKRTKSTTTSIKKMPGKQNSANQSNSIKASTPLDASFSGAAGVASGGEEAGVKSKSTRGSRACTVCRRLKMRCEPAEGEDQSKCKRCRQGGHECIFEESQRGRRKNQKTDAMARSLKNMESTLETVLRSIASGNPQLVAGLTIATDGTIVDSNGQPVTASSLPPMHTPVVGPDTTRPPLPSPTLTQTQLYSDPHNNNNFASTVNMSGIPLFAQNIRPNGLQDFSSPFAIPGNPLPPLPVPNVTNISINGSGQQSHLQHPSMRSGTSSSTADRAPSIKTEDAHSGPGSTANLVANSPALRLPSLPEPENTWAPLGLLAEASLENNQQRQRRDTLDAQRYDASPSHDNNYRSDNSNGKQKLGVANDAYFKPGPFNVLPLRQLLIDKNLPSPLLTEKIITIEEAVQLFDTYHQRCSMFTAHYINQEFHTPINVSSRSTFLFTTICAVASKFYEARPELYGLCMPYARKLASLMIESGFKSVEIVQAYMLLAFYNTPTERFEDDRTYTYSGLAIRMAVELNLWRNPALPADLDEETRALWQQEAMNRERTWMEVFIMDRSTALQTGRPHTLRLGAFERNAKRWAAGPLARPTDASLAAILEVYSITSGLQDLLRLSCFEESRGHDSCVQDYAIVTRAVETALDNWNSEWYSSAISTDSVEGKFTATMKTWYFNWHRLLAFSFALQQILKTTPSSMEILPYFLPCYSSATEVIRLVRDELHTHGYLRYAIDAIFINTSYAAVFLLKLLRPELAEFVDTETILKEVESIVQVFESCSVDDVHTPRLYAGFLKLLLSSRQQSAKGTGFNTSNGQDINVSLDPTLANKLFESQQQIHTTFAHQPALDSAAVNTFGGSVEPMHTQMQMHNIMGAGGAEPSNMSLNTGFNLDQLGQTGFWDNLSMPGIGSPPTYSLHLSAGNLFAGDPWSFSMPNSAAPSRATSPKLSTSLSSYGLPNMSSI